jgi:hypothetical protein
MDQREPTLSELLSEPIIRMVMARDGVCSIDVRKLLQQADARKRVRAHNHSGGKIGSPEAQLVMNCSIRLERSGKVRSDSAVVRSHRRNDL